MVKHNYPTALNMLKLVYNEISALHRKRIYLLNINYNFINKCALLRHSERSGWGLISCGIRRGVTGCSVSDCRKEETVFGLKSVRASQYMARIRARVGQCLTVRSFLVSSPFWSCQAVIILYMKGTVLLHPFWPECGSFLCHESQSFTVARICIFK